MKNLILLPLTTLLTITPSPAQQETPLYQHNIPNSRPNNLQEKTTKNDAGIPLTHFITKPTLTFFPSKSTTQPTPAILICPGGGYSLLSLQSEGTDIARWLANHGISAYVLKYRLPNDASMLDKSTAPLMDAQQAIITIRQQAHTHNINPNQIGIMGFSAGGHLASTLLTHYEKSLVPNPKNISLRPNFAILIYPVITFTKLTHGGTRTNLVNNDTSKFPSFSNELHVTQNTPPTYLYHCQNDPAVNLQDNTLAFYQALLKNHIKSELHLPQLGGHGFGMINPATHENILPPILTWLRINQILNP